MSDELDPAGAEYVRRRLALFRVALKLSPFLLVVFGAASYFVFRIWWIIAAAIVVTTIGVWWYRNHQLNRAMRDVDRELDGR